MSAGRGPADPSAKNIWCDAKDHARPRKYLEQNTFSKRGVQVELDLRPRWARAERSARGSSDPRAGSLLPDRLALAALAVLLGFALGPELLGDVLTGLLIDDL